MESFWAGFERAVPILAYMEPTVVGNRIHSTTAGDGFPRVFLII